MVSLQGIHKPRFRGPQAYETTKDVAGGQSDASRTYRKEGSDVNRQLCMAIEILVFWSDCGDELWLNGGFLGPGVTWRAACSKTMY